MTESLAHRGPDASGIWADPAHRCVFGHRRLSIVDLSETGAQPMSAPSTPWVLTFNGEIYNFPLIRVELERAGVVFSGRSDTEVLLQAITAWGEDAVARLDGMFAFAAFNRHTGETLLARDPFGEKPLYYCDAGSAGLAFASEIRALERLPWFRREVSADRLAEMLMFQYVGAPRTIYDAVSQVPPGHTMHVDRRGRRRVTRYFAYEPGVVEDDGRPLWAAADEVEDLLAASLERRMVADVPLGALLSGGVDSATVCALATRRLGIPLATFSLGFRGAPESETEVAAAIAREIGSDHHELVVDGSAVDFLREIGDVLDEPNGDVSCFPTYLLSRLVREHVTVAISGDGGDEMFGGYSRYLNTLNDLQRRPRGRFGSEYYGSAVLVMSDLEIRALFGLVPEGLRAHLRSLRGSLEAQRGTPLAAMRATDAANYMPGAVLAKVDRMSMQHSLEVRTPFLNVDLVRCAAGLPPRLLVGGGYGKLVLREVAARYLPREIVDLPKKGFGLPSQDWARGPIQSVARDRLLGPGSRLAGIVGFDRMRQFLMRPYRLEPLWALVALESWLRVHDPDVTGLTPAVAPGRVGGSPRVARRARWLSSETLIVVDDAFQSSRSEPEADGCSGIGRGVTGRALNVLRALRPILRSEAPASDGTWVDLPPDDTLGAALQRGGLSVTHARVVWFRADALVSQGPRSQLARVASWLRYRLLYGSVARDVGNTRSLIIVNPFDDSCDLPVVTHKRRVVPARVGRRIVRYVPSWWRPEVGVPPRSLPWRVSQDLVGLPQVPTASSGPLRRALIVTHALPSGGAERQWCYLAAGLRARGVDARLVTTHPLVGPDAHYLPLAENAGVPITELPDISVGDLLTGVTGEDLCAEVQGADEGEFRDLALRLSAMCRKNHPDALFAQLDLTNVVTAFTGVRVGVPRTVLSFRNYNPDNFSYLRNAWYRDVYRSLSTCPDVRLAGNSRAGNDDYASWLGLPRRKVAFIPNAIDQATIGLGAPNGLPDRTATRRALGLDPDAPIVLGAFRLSEEKRVSLFVEVCARVREHVPEVRVLVVGRGPQEDILRHAISCHAVEDVVTILGARTDMEALFASADVLLLTSRFEGMPNVAAEAQALGVPVVGPRVGALPDLLDDGRTGIVCEDDSARTLAAAVARVLCERDLWRARTEEAAAAFAERYSIDRMVDAYIDLASASAT